MRSLGHQRIHLRGCSRPKGTLMVLLGRADPYGVLGRFVDNYVFVQYVGDAVQLLGGCQRYKGRMGERGEGGKGEGG